MLVVRYGRTREQIAGDIKAGLADVANPDVVERLRTGAPFTEVDHATLYGGGSAGYTDYPTVDQD